MTKSDTIGKLAAALLKAQKNIGAATKGAANPFFKSKYADLGSVMEACKEALNNEGIAVTQPVGNENGRHTVTTMLLHESGEFMAETMVLEVPKANMQDLGSAISYARRYGLQSFGFIPAEDDDGEKTMARGAATATAAPGVRKAASFTKPVVEAKKQEAPVPVQPTIATPIAAKTTTTTPKVTINGTGKAAASVDGWE